MAEKFALEDLFDAVKMRADDKAMALVGRAKMEVDKLACLRGLNEDRRNAVKYLKDFIQNVTDRQFKSARDKYERAQRTFSGSFKGLLEDVRKSDAAKERSAHPQKEPEIDYDQEPENPYPHDGSQRNGRDRAGDESNKPSDMTVTMRNKDFHKQDIPKRSSKELYEDSKRASQAMRLNNPDIADLSDVNRPTKVAEKFSELYDNEWTEAFDVLCNRKGEDEKKTAKLLLTIVKEAYHFCRQKAEKEIQVMHSAILDILEFGQYKGSKHDKPVNSTLLVQYRKEYGSKAIKRLQTEYFETKLKKICKTSVGGKAPSNSGAMEKYGSRAVELTWWMCVQDPPVYMCPAEEQGFSPDLYRPYTKTGKIINFFVWPALRLYENGGLLSKGVVQYK